MDKKTELVFALKLRDMLSQMSKVIFEGELEGIYKMNKERAIDIITKYISTLNNYKSMALIHYRDKDIKKLLKFQIDLSELFDVLLRRIVTELGYCIDKGYDSSRMKEPFETLNKTLTVIIERLQ